MRQQRGQKPYLQANDRKNISKNIRYSENEFAPIRKLLIEWNMTYTDLAKTSINAYLNGLKTSKID
jgi:hypothetical protein